MASNLSDVGDSPSQPKDVTHKSAVDVVLNLPVTNHDASKCCPARADT